ncbi:hypothetical protein IGB42_03755 [Andreprevotia sp. IGB-42]|uniref:hypothetical protein n=1 Tax=Andreprevotia sp. IGB-42 TaxID=2497473 RepID=UPI0013578DAF|nr:hypothetical protein [Andreprevotia sp. IGB-42]KAF0811738.1 hypothetical protein IGB42_03755 [Andreprevotia sp. IGB-42]
MLRKLVLSVALLLTAVAAQATTSLQFKSEPGDYIGQGKNATWQETDGTFTINKNFDKGVSVSFNGGTAWWSLDFAAPGEVPLLVQAYEEAQRFPFQSITKPGLNVSGSGRGCNTVTGRFDVLELTYKTNGDIDRFAANFEQHCEGANAALKGTVLYNSTLSGVQPPKITVTANGSDKPLYVNVGQSITVNVKVEANSKKNALVERWAGFVGTKGAQWFNGSGWSYSSNPMLAAVDYLQDGTFNYQITPTAAGAHVFEYGVDEGANHAFDAQYLNQLLIIAR